MSLFGLFGPPNIEQLKQKGDIRGLLKARGHEDYFVSNEADLALRSIHDNTRGVKPLIAVLNDEEAGVIAARALGYLEDPLAVESLCAALKDGPNEVRCAAAEALGKLKDGRAEEHLIAALGDDYWRVRMAAVQALGEFKDVEPCIGALKDEHPDVRWVAAKVLVVLKDDRSVEHLIAALGDEYWRVRKVAAQALGELKDARAVEPCIVALKDEHSDVREEAAKVLVVLNDVRSVEPLIAALNDDNEDVRSAAAEVLGELNDSRAVEPLIPVLRDRRKDVRGAAREAVRKFGTAAVEPLIVALGDRSKAVRRAAAEALGELGDPRAVEPLSNVLTSALNEEDNVGQRAVTKALQAIGGREAARVLSLYEGTEEDIRKSLAVLEDADLVVKDEDLERRLDAALDLVAARGEWGIRALLQRLYKGIKIVDGFVDYLDDYFVHDPGTYAWNEYLRKLHIVEALGRARAESAVDSLAELVSAYSDLDTHMGEERGLFNTQLRTAAAASLKKIGSEAALQALAHAVRRLIDSLEDLPEPQQGTVYVSLKVLGEEIGNPTVALLTAALESNPSATVRYYAALILGAIGDPAVVDALFAALDDRDEWVRRNSASALGKIGDKRAVERLLIALTSDDWIMRVNAAKSLGQIEDTRAVDALVVAASDENETVRRSAAWALAELKDTRAVQVLVAALTDADEVVRETAVDALDRLGGPEAERALAEYATARDARVSSPEAGTGPGSDEMSKKDRLSAAVALGWQLRMRRRGKTGEIAQADPAFWDFLDERHLEMELRQLMVVLSEDEQAMVQAELDSDR